MPQILHDDDIARVRDDVYLVSGSATNWIIIKEGETGTLIDTGYPADHEKLLASLLAVGLSPQAVSALLVTHAHTDHIGGAERLRVEHDVPVLMHEEEVPHARRDFLQQVTVGDVLKQAWRPGVLPWALHAIRAGGTYHVPVTAPRSFPEPGPLDLPGAPTPLHTPGHTVGHCAFHLPRHGILVSGDALITAHPTSRLAGPQLLPDMFHGDREAALASLDRLDGADADVILPGHGPAHHGDVREAVELARERARR